MDVRRTSTTPELIAAALREEIQTGRVPPGHALRQEELASRFSVSRIPVRDALVRLEAEGLVEIFPNRGAFVAKLTADEIAELFDLRVLLEGDLVARAVAAMDADTLEALDLMLIRAERGALGPHWSTLDDDFHAALYGAAGRPRQLALIRSLRTTVRRYATSYGSLPEQTERWLEDHRRIVQACRNRDAASARAEVEAHVRDAGALVLARMEGV